VSVPNIFNEGELEKQSVVRKFRTTTSDQNNAKTAANNNLDSLLKISKNKNKINE